MLAAAKMNLPGGAFAQGAGPEVKGTKLGYIALTDASPLIIAKEKGFYAKHGVPDMEISKQASWGATRDNMALGTEGERHRRRPHPAAEGASLFHRRGDAEQAAAADVHAAQPERGLPGDLGRAMNTRTWRQAGCRAR